MDSPPTDRVKFAGTAAEEKVPDILDAISRASMRTISDLKAILEPQSLHRAVSLLGGAGKTCIVGFGDAYPVAALLASGLNERGRGCSVFGPHAGSAEPEISLLGPDDLLVLIKLPGDGLPEDSLADAAGKRGSGSDDRRACRLSGIGLLPCQLAGTRNQSLRDACPGRAHGRSPVAADRPGPVSRRY